MRAFAAAAGLLAVGAPAAHAIDPVAATVDRTTGLTGPPPAALERAQDRLRAELGARALLQADPTAGTPRVVARLDGHLTAPSPRAPDAIALDYVRAHGGAFGLDGSDLATLRLNARRRGADGTVHLVWEQQVGGVPNVDGGLQAAVDGDGRLINVRGGPLPDPQASTTTPAISAEAAYQAAVPGAASPPAGAPRGAEQRTPFLGGGEASLVLYRDGDADRLGWRVLAAAGSDAFYDAIVDARTGRLQRRVNRTHSAAQIHHYDVSPRASGDAPALSSVKDEWLYAGERRLKGPYVHAILDLDDSISLTHDGSGYGLSQQPDANDEVAPRTPPTNPNPRWDYDLQLGPDSGFCSLCTWDNNPLNTTANREYSAAQLFWYVNTFRDHLADAPIGFVGPGAFEGDDAVLAQALDGASPAPGVGPDANHLSNASMTVLPDGFPGLMQMYLFGLTIAALNDGAMDASVVYHEYAHGLSERLVTDAQGFGALAGPQPGALSEGISDWYAMDFLAETEPAIDDVPARQGDVRVGRWLHSNSDPTLRSANSMRTESLDCSAEAPDTNRCRGPLPPGTAGAGGYTYDDFGKVAGAPNAHADGEIWAQTLWSLRSELGVERTRAYVTEGLRLAPDDPTFLDMRNAIVQAAETLHPGEDWDTIWNVFKARGMGWSATTDGATDVSPFAAFDTPPPASAGSGAIAGTIEDELGAPVAGATVAVGGHDSGLGATDISTLSDAAGGFALADVPAGDYADLYFHKPGYQELTTGVTVTAGQTATRTIKPLRRDYASAHSGAGASTTGPNYGADGCGPAQAIDDDKGTVWSTDAGTPQYLVVDLGRELDIAQVRIDPRAGCGDPPEASLATYELAASNGPGQPYEAIAGGTVGALDARGFATLSLAGDLTGRRLLRLTAIAPRGAGAQYMDVSELEVTGTPSVAPPPTGPSTAPTPTPTPPAAAPSPTPSQVVATKFRVSKLSASRKGTFKVKVRFGSAAPAGTARLRVLSGKKPLASGKLTVRRLRTSTKTLRLNATGRRMIKPGRTRKVTLELRLPGGQKVKQAVKLARSKR